MQRDLSMPSASHQQEQYAERLINAKCIPPVGAVCRETYQCQVHPTSRSSMQRDLSMPSASHQQEQYAERLINAKCIPPVGAVCRETYQCQVHPTSRSSMQRDLSMPSASHQQEQYAEILINAKCIPLTLLESGGFWIPAVTDLAIGVVDLETARENFNKNVLQPYLEEVSRQISCRFKDTLGLLTAFSIFDPQKCPTDVQQLHKYGTAELEKLLKFYGETTEIEYEGNVFSTPADVDKTETRHEQNWSSLRRRVCH